MIRDWAGRRYWVLGAADPLGRAVAHQLSRVGTELVLSAPALDDLGRLAEELPGRARALAADPSDRASLEAVVREVGDLDGLVVLSEARLPQTVEDWDPRRFEAMCDANLMGAARAVGLALPAMLSKGAGHVVLTGLQGAARRGARDAVGFAASKAAVMALARSLRSELAGHGVEVQLVDLGPVEGRADGDRRAPVAGAEDAARRIFEHMSSDAFEAGVGAPSWLARLAG